MHRHTGFARRVAAGLVALLLPACYVSQPLTTPAPAPNTHIVADLTDRGTADMDPVLGPRAERIDAVVASADTVTWNLKLLRVSRRNARFEPWNGEVVPFPASAFDTVVVRRLSRGRSLLTAAAIAGGTVLLAALFHVVGVGDSNGGGGPTPQQ